ncbi:FGGY family carbohydrate kinase, partial [Nonomuraea sp. NPDC055795]
MPLVAGVDSSTQSCKVVVLDADSGQLVRQGRAAHPEGTSVDPAAWWEALALAVAEAGGLEDVAAVGVAGQQHGMVCLDESGNVVRDALLWNDTRSAGAARDLVDALGGGAAWASAVGVVPLASFTVSKVRWLAEHEPDHARRTAAVCLPHDWLTWRLLGEPPRTGLSPERARALPPERSHALRPERPHALSLERLTTDRGDASGTGYWSPFTGSYRYDLLELAMGSRPALPRVLGPAEAAGEAGGLLVAAGTGDNMAAALGLGLRPGDVVVSIGTSGTAFAVADRPGADPSG